jgi:hypothetical protein
MCNNTVARAHWSPAISLSPGSVLKLHPGKFSKC